MSTRTHLALVGRRVQLRPGPRAAVSLDCRDGMHVACLTCACRCHTAVALNRWTRGDRYGVVTSIIRGVCVVLMDRSGKTVRVHSDDLTLI